MKKVVFFLITLLLTLNVSAEISNTKNINGEVNYLVNDPSILLPYDSPSGVEWLTSAPENLLSFTRNIKPVENAGWLAGIAASSLLLIYYDQEITDAAQSLGRKIGLISDTRTGRETTTLIDWQAGGYDLPLVVPANSTSLMYFFGDGLAHLGVVGGLLGYGLYYDDKRSISTASQTVEALLVTGIVVQVLKRSTGREAPFLSTQDGGKWQWFPNQIEYNKHVPQFDAFPSGHLATVMATTTVLAENYPEKGYIWPVGGTVMTLLGFAMLNNGVHWAGDYPLGLGIGYLAGKVVVERNRKKRIDLLNKKNTLKPGALFLPFYRDGATGLNINYWF